MNTSMYLCLRRVKVLQRSCFERHSMRHQISRTAPYVALIHKCHMSEDTYRTYFSPESPPIGFAQDVVEGFHSITGLPWWASLILTTVALRGCITLPLQIYSNHILAKVENLQPEVMEISKRLKVEVAHAMKKFEWSEKFTRKKYNANMKRLIGELYIRDNCHPAKASVVMLVQLPMWISLSFALRNMSGFFPYSGQDFNCVCAELATGGLFWFTDLTLPDSTWILPVVLGVSNLLIVEMQTWKKGGETKFQKVLTNFLRGVSVVMIPIAASVPSCMCLYWVCSSLFGFAQNVVFKFPRVRRALGIPQTPSESQTPIQDMIQAARTKYSHKKTQE